VSCRKLRQTSKNRQLARYERARARQRHRKHDKAARKGREDGLMYCPKCSTEQLSDETRYCSRCGFLLTHVSELIENDGVMPLTAPRTGKPTRRQQALKHALYIVIAAVLIVPFSALVVYLTGSSWSQIAIPSIILLVAAVLRVAVGELIDSYEKD